MARDAVYFLLPLGAAAVAAFWAAWTVAGLVLLGLAAFTAFFFRDPDREIPPDPAAIVSPADGRIVRIETQGGMTRVSIFLSIFNVHVNRSPIDGRIRKIEYRKGRFHAAFNHAASVDNEQNVLTIASGGDDGFEMTCSQIAGVVARRIVCWKKAGDTVARGERIGLIRFGSRADLVFPPGVDLQVQVGDAVKAGSSTIGIIRRSQ